MFSSDPQTIRASKGPAAPQVYLQKDVYRRLMMRNRPKNNDFDRQFKKVNLSKLAAANSTSKKQRKYFSMINEFQTSLQKSAFEMGFFKAATACGLEPKLAVALYKKAFQLEGSVPQLSISQ